MVRGTVQAQDCTGSQYSKVTENAALILRVDIGIHAVDRQRGLIPHTVKSAATSRPRASASLGGGQQPSFPDA